MLIIDATPQGRGWYPINHMVRLAARLFDADVEVMPAGRRPSAVKRVGSLISRRRVTGRETDTCLMICASPADLLQLLEIPNWRTRFRFVAAWVIDSFWIEWIPSTVRASLPVDHIFITSGEDVDDWHRAVGRRPTWLPWGTDALHLGSGSAARRFDLTRVGRQPPEWEDDRETAKAASALGIRFRPRPEELEQSPSRNQESLMQAYGSTKYLLAFSNLSNPTNYTHPTRQYITGRWADALGSGAVVAGCAPQGAMIDSLLWPEATLELGSTDRDKGLHAIAEELPHWAANVARTNHAMALQRLDWRHRFEAIAKVFGDMPIRLADELGELKQRCREVDGSGHGRAGAAA